jgi:uncharacterized protein YecT (DUF1311 family)
MRRSCLLALFALAMLVPRLAFGAGGDCSAAGSDRERLVCGDDALSAADSKVAETYAAALHRLSPEGQQRLRQSQLGWSAYVDALCPMIKHPEEHTQAVSCLALAFADRIRDLQMAAVSRGPYLFSRVDEYRVSTLRARADQYDTGLASHHVSYPRIDQPVTSQTSEWNALVVRGDQFNSCDSGDGDTVTNYSIGFVTADLISLDWVNSEYCHGTPHGFGESESQTLVLSPQPHPLKPADLFRSDAPWAERLAALLLAGVKQAARDKNVAFEERDAAPIADVARDTRRWSLGTDGIGFQFDAYEIGPYIFQPRVVVSWVDLRDVMVQKPPVP